MSVRTLPPEEWDRLDAESAAFFRTVRAEDIAVLVAEEGGRIVGHVAVVRAPFWERWWVAEDKFGNAGVTRGLLCAAREKAREWAPNWLMAHGDDQMARTLIRLGGEFLPIHTFMLHHHEERGCLPQ